MIKITAGELLKPEFMHACKKLHGATGLGAKTAYQAAKIIEALNKELNIVRDQHKNLAFEYGELSEGGGLVPTEQEPYFKIKEGKEVSEYQAKVAELLAVEITVEREPLKLDAVSEVKLSPAEVSALSSFIVE